MEINVPAKVIGVTLNTISSKDLWPYYDNLGDQFWSSGTSPKIYIWEVSMIVNTQTHSSHLTRNPGSYTGLDIYVGDWIAGAEDGVACRIISILSKNDTTVTCMVEDFLRYNTFKDPAGIGVFAVPGPGVVFSLNENGEPLLDPFPGTFSPGTNFFSNIESRFESFYYQQNFMLKQVGNTFSKGNIIAIDPVTGDYELADSNSREYTIGRVTNILRGSPYFLVNPLTKIVDNIEPALPGIKGDKIYVDHSAPGGLTTVDTGLPIYLQLTNAVPSWVNGTVISAVTSIGNILEINGVDVTFSTGTGTITDAVADINSLSTSHYVTALEVQSAVTILTNNLDLVYGVTAGATPFSASINGVLVNFNDDAYGEIQFGTGYASKEDIVKAINDANIPNIIADWDANGIVLTNIIGGSITIVNLTNDSSGNPFAGPTSCTGLSLLTPANSGVPILRLVRNDGGGIILQDKVGIPTIDFGVVSVQNGILPIGMVIEQGIRKGDMYVVANIAARDALEVLVGDQAYVLNKGDSEWGLYLYDGSVWSLTGTEESAKVDSDTYSITVTPASSAITLIGEINSGSRVTMVTVEVISAFDGSPVLTVGDISINDRLMTSDQIDLGTISTYQATPAYMYNGGTDHNINAYFTLGGATTGSAKITITYS